MNTPTMNLIIHKLCKEMHGPASIELRQQEMTVSPLARQLVDQLSELYSAKAGKGYGKFEEDENSFPLPRLLRGLVQDQSLDFGELTRQMMQNLLERVQSEPLASGGYVLFARVRNGAAADFLLVAIISEARGTALTAGLEMVESPYLDLANLRVAGKIDLAAWLSDSGRYISFLKGRTEVAQYFKQFLACNDVVAALKETQKLIKGIEQFAEAQQMEPEARNQLFEEAHRYLDDLGENDLPWSVDTVVNQLCPDAPEALRATLKSEELALSEGCIPDRRAIRPLLRFKASAPNWKLEFNRNSLRSGDVIYNRNNDTIVLYNIPDELKRELQAETRKE
ncbi:nucleoid-associated protein [Formivibrio citricus]|uniref:Nucleoid-associated protein n=1 Tax=Formivibrio citricus TaxID=83765 RepID=A0A1I5DYB2_9NEIS|nr:nucleoid-associated protein [Formivibrio citricus]SFO04117.1 nucleoid-associated protein [Formivibrio citricus]